MHRRNVLRAAVPVAAALAGCSGSNEEPATDTEESAASTASPTEEPATTTDTPTDTQTATASDVPTAQGMPDDEVGDGVIETLADYEYVASRPDEFVGSEIRSDGGTGKIKYYQAYGEEYQGFRALFEAGTRPFFFKTDASFMDSDVIAFTGTVEKTGEIQGHPVIYVENADIETNP